MNGYSPWYAAIHKTLSDATAQTIYDHSLHGYSIQAQLTDHALWLGVKWPDGGSIAVRTAYAPDVDLQLIKSETFAGGVSFEFESLIGQHFVQIKYEPGENSRLPLHSQSGTFPFGNFSFLAAGPCNVGKIRPSQWPRPYFAERPPLRAVIFQSYQTGHRFRIVLPASGLFKGL